MRLLSAVCRGCVKIAWYKYVPVHVLVLVLVSYGASKWCHVCSWVQVIIRGCTSRSILEWLNCMHIWWTTYKYKYSTCTKSLGFHSESQIKGKHFYEMTPFKRPSGFFTWFTHHNVRYHIILNVCCTFVTRKVKLGTWLLDTNLVPTKCITRHTSFATDTTWWVLETGAG